MGASPTLPSPFGFDSVPETSSLAGRPKLPGSPSISSRTFDPTVVPEGVSKEALEQSLTKMIDSLSAKIAATGKSGGKVQALSLMHEYLAQWKAVRTGDIGSHSAEDRIARMKRIEDRLSGSLDKSPVGRVSTKEARFIEFRDHSFRLAKDLSHIESPCSPEEKQRAETDRDRVLERITNELPTVFCPERRERACRDRRHRGLIVLPDVDIARAALGAGFDRHAAEVAVAVALSESSGAPGNNLRTRKEDSRGLWQINCYAHGDKIQRSGGSWSQLYDPDYCAKWAYSISGGGRNWTPWTNYRNGDYREYMDRARKAVAAATQG